MNTLVFYSGYNVSTLFRNLQEVFSAQGASHSPNIVTHYSKRSCFLYYNSTFPINMALPIRHPGGDELSNSVGQRLGKRHQYSACLTLTTVSLLSYIQNISCRILQISVKKNLYLYQSVGQKCVDRLTDEHSNYSMALQYRFSEIILMYILIQKTFTFTIFIDVLSTG